jgi:hypothetical protein
VNTPGRCGQNVGIVGTPNRLAVVPSKFRSPEEPDPFVIEISMKDDEPWAMREVTGEVEAALEGARRDAATSRRATRFSPISRIAFRYESRTAG